MRAELRHSLIDDSDLVGPLNGGQPMRDSDRRARLVLVELVQSSLHHLQFVKCGCVLGGEGQGTNEHTQGRLVGDIGLV